MRNLSAIGKRIGELQAKGQERRSPLGIFLLPRDQARMEAFLAEHPDSGDPEDPCRPLAIILKCTRAKA